MKLINNSKNAMMHKVGKEYLILEVGKVLDVPDDVAKLWLKYAGIQTYATPEDIEEAKKKAVKEALAKEKAKQEKKAKKTTKKDEVVEEKEEEIKE